MEALSDTVKQKIQDDFMHELGLKHGSNGRKTYPEDSIVDCLGFTLNHLHIENTIDSGGAPLVPDIKAVRKKFKDWQKSPCGDKDKLLTLEEYNILTPYEKGYVDYIQASWPESPLDSDDDSVPYEAGTKELDEFCKGSHAAMMFETD